jgi:hypothetical protein
MYFNSEEHRGVKNHRRREKVVDFGRGGLMLFVKQIMRLNAFGF